MRLPDALKAARHSKGWSASALALSLKVSRRAVEQWESGAEPVSVDRLYTIAHVLGLERHDLQILLDADP